MSNFQEDFLERIVSVHWNDLYAFIVAPGSAPTGETAFGADVSFPGMAGGTPGYPLVDTSVPNPSFKPTPFAITQKLLQGKLPTDAGAEVFGFGSRFSGFPAGPDFLFCSAGVLIKIPTVRGNIFNIRFTVRNDIEGVSGCSMYVYLFKGAPKGGMVMSSVPEYFTLTVHPTDTDYVSMYGHTSGGLHGTFDFTINTQTLIVDAADFDPHDVHIP